MTRLWLLCWLTLLPRLGRGQDPAIARAWAAVQAHPQPDTGRVNRLNTFALLNYATAPAQTRAANQEALVLARRLRYPQGEAVALLGLGFYHRFRNEYAPAQTYTQQALRLFRHLGDTMNQVKCHYNAAYITFGQGQFAPAMTASFAGLQLAEPLADPHWRILLLSQLGNTCLQLGEYDQAQTYLSRGLRLAEAGKDLSGIAHCAGILGDVHRRQGRWAEARRCYEQAMAAAEQSHNQKGITMGLLSVADMNERLGNYPPALAGAYRVLGRLRQLQDVGGVPEAQLVLARAYLHMGRADSARAYGQAALRASQRSGTKSTIRDASDVLAQASAAQGRFADAYRYHVLFKATQESLRTQDLTRRTAALQYRYALDKQQSQIRLLTRNQQLITQQNRQQRLFLGGALAALAVVAGLSVLLWRNNQAKQRANTRLRATQAQLVQAEKLAALGELTAGIAHELQNPLNFVTNFADLSAELSQELQEEAQAGHPEEVVVLADELQQNLRRITHHGQQAARIVSGMLEHARPSTGQRHATDLAALCQESLQRTYQGWRQKHPTAEVRLTTEWDPHVGLVELVPQDMGRVLGNLFTNALDALQQRAQGAKGMYAPEVSVRTQQQDGQVQVCVRDNGVGMSEAVQAKIFQPFFTTKPPGEGTGLGLSLSYDIVTKGHGGTLTVSSREGEGTEVLVSLPRPRPSRP